MTLHLFVGLHVYSSLPRVDKEVESLMSVWGNVKLKTTEAVLSLKDTRGWCAGLKESGRENRNTFGSRRILALVRTKIYSE